MLDTIHTMGALAFALVLATCCANLRAAPRGHGSLLVINQGDKTMSVVDPETNRQIATVDEAQTTMHGHEIAASPDGRTAYIPIYGSSGVGSPGLDGSEMLAVAPEVPVRTSVSTYPLEEANTALEDLRGGRFSGAAVIVP